LDIGKSNKFNTKETDSEWLKSKGGNWRAESRSQTLACFNTGHRQQERRIIFILFLAGRLMLKNFKGQRAFF
jgi:hypothetical protein